MGNTEKQSEIGIGWCLVKFCVLLEAWKLILCSTLGVAGLTIAAVIVFPGDYRSETILPLTTKAKAAFATESFLDAVIKDSALLAEAEGNIEVARRRLRKQLTKPIDIERESGLFRIVLRDSSPSRAQTFLGKVVAQILVESRPVGSALASTLQQIDALENSIPELEKLSGQIAQNVKRVQDGLEGEQFARALATLYNDIAQKRLKVIELKRFLAGTHEDDVIQRPTVGELERSKILVVLSVTIAAFALVATFVFVRSAFLRARAVPELALTIQRIQHILYPSAGTGVPTQKETSDLAVRRTVSNRS